MVVSRSVFIFRHPRPDPVSILLPEFTDEDDCFLERIMRNSRSYPVDRPRQAWVFRESAQSSQASPGLDGSLTGKSPVSHNQPE